MPKKLATPGVFKPTPAMIVWVDTAVELATDNKSKIMEKCGVDRNNWYEWIKKEGFEDWYFAMYKKKRTRWLPMLDAAGMRMALNSEKGYGHWKDLRRAAGEVDEPTNNQQVNVLVMPKELSEKYDVEIASNTKPSSEK